MHWSEPITLFTGFISIGTIAISIGTIALGIIAWQQRKDSRIIQRAYLAVDGLGIEPFHSKSIAQLSVRNAGRLPATEVSWFIGCRVSENGRDEDFPISENEFHGSNTIPPGAEMRRSQDFTVDEDQLTNFFKDDRKFVYVWGEIRYLDGYGKQRKIRFCQRYDQRGKGVVPDGKAFAGKRMLIAESMRFHKFGNYAD
jgi:hypothetical protein